MNDAVRSKFCRNCGAKVASEDVFCPFCNSEISSKVYCGICGAANRQGQAFCEHCGASLNDNTSVLFAQKDDSQSMSTRNKSSDEQEAVLPVDKERKVIQKHATWNCRQCKAVNDEQNKFCISCGARKRLHETELERPGKSIYQEDQLPKTSECSEQDDKPTARTGVSSKHKIIVAVLAVIASVTLVFLGFQLNNILPIGQHNESEEQGEAVSAQKQEETPEQNETTEQDEIILQEQPTVTEEMPDEPEQKIEQEPVEPQIELIQYLNKTLSMPGIKESFRSYSEYTHTGYSNGKVTMTGILGSDVFTRIEMKDTQQYSIEGVTIGQSMYEAGQILESKDYLLHNEGEDGCYVYKSCKKDTDLQITLKEAISNPDIVESVCVEDLSKKLDLIYFICKDIYEFEENMPDFSSVGVSSGIELSDGSAIVSKSSVSEGISFIGIFFGDCPYSICGVEYGMSATEAEGHLLRAGFIKNQESSDALRHCYSKNDNLSFVVSCVSETEQIADCIHLQAAVPLPQTTEFNYADTNNYIDLIDYIGMDIDEFCEVFRMARDDSVLGSMHSILVAYVVPGEREILGFDISYFNDEIFTIAGITSSTQKSHTNSMLKAAGFEEEGRTEYIRVYFREEDNMRVHISGTGIANTTVQRVSDKQTEMIALYRLD